MSRILAIDYGIKRTGIAVSDPMQIIANKLDTIPTNTLFKFLNNYLNKENVSCIVVGYPLNTDGSQTRISRLVSQLIIQLKKKFSNVKIDIEDERFTSTIAKRTILEGGVKKMKRRNKALVDAVSATIILQSYLKRIKKDD